MTLSELITKLDRTGFDLDAEQLLDAFWLASLGLDLSLGAPLELPTAPASPETKSATAARTGAPSAQQRQAQPPPILHAASPNTVPVIGPVALRAPSKSIFARGEVPPHEAHMNASPVTLPAPRMLSNRLGLMRALRPLTQRWPSSNDLEVDEEGTVEAIARTGARQPVVPVFRSQGERWFEVELVLEEDASVELWADLLREFADVLRDGGMFRAVGVWRLRTRNLPSHGAYLENAGGARMSTAAFLGKAARRLIVFASNGASSRWSDGRYTEVLGPWIRDNAVLLLQLSTPSRWARTRLGEPHGLASTTVPGAHTSTLHVDGDWWRRPEPAAGETLVPLPVVDLTPSSLGRWAAMQMARGRPNPAYLLKWSWPGHVSSVATPRAGRGAALPIERMIAALQYESPDSVRLATLLSTAPFTVSVARLVQAIEFEGSTDPDMLAELMRSGIVVDVSRLPGSNATMAATYFRVRPEASEHLLRALRRSEAAELGREVQRRVSAHLATLTGSTVRSLELVADEAGRKRLPAWVQPFAHVATSLLGLPDTDQATQERFQRCIGSLPQAAVYAIATLAAENHLLPERLAPELWTRLLTYGLIYQSVDGQWTFAPGVRDMFGAMRPTQISGAMEARAVGVALDVLQSMAKAFHAGQLPGIKNASDGITQALLHWKNERAAALAHWIATAEYVFAGPVTRLLATGESPFEKSHDDFDRETLCKMLDTCEQALTSKSGGSGRSGVLAQLRLAIRLLSLRRPALFEDVLIPFIEDEVCRFLDEASPSDDEGRWRDDALTTIGWLRNDDVMQAIAPYMNLFFQGFGDVGWTELALSADYPVYLEALLATWHDATKDILSLNADSLTLLQIPFSVNADSIEWVRANMPSIGMRGLNSRTGVAWTVPVAGYFKLIEELGAILLRAVRRRIARGRWQPQVMWVDDLPENNSVERARMLKGCDVEYTIVTSTEEALLLCQVSLFDAVISDMGRPGDSRAGYTLIDGLRSRHNTVPFVIYSRGQQPHHLAEALQHGAVGTTDSMHQLAGLVLEALLRYDEALARRFSPDLLLAYTERRFPRQGTSSQTNWRICRDVDESEFLTLLDVDRAVDTASSALAALIREQDGLFQTGTDYLAISLCLASQQFRRVHALPADIQKLVARHALRPSHMPSTVHNGIADADSDEDGDDELDLQRLARRLGELMTAGQASVLYAQMEHALGAAVDAGDWLVNADSYLSVESEEEYAQLESWNLLEHGSEMFVPNKLSDGALSVTVRVMLVIDVHSGFNFSVTDSIDKDQVSMGYTEASRRVTKTVEVDMSVTAIEDGDPHADTIDVETIAMQVDFGYVEPDDFNSDEG